MQDHDSGPLNPASPFCRERCSAKMGVRLSQNCFDFRPSGDTVSADDSESTEPIGLPGDTKQ